jgi:hypothetical protein
VDAACADGDRPGDTSVSSTVEPTASRLLPASREVAPTIIGEAAGVPSTRAFEDGGGN